FLSVREELPMAIQPTEARRLAALEEFRNPAIGYQLLLRLRIQNRPGMLGRVTTALGDAGANIMDIDIQEAGASEMVRDFRIMAEDEGHAQRIATAVDNIEGVEVVHA